MHPTSLSIRAAPPGQLRQFASGGYLYALLDAYGVPAVPAKVQELGGAKAVSLFVGEAEKKYWSLAPYVISVDEATFDWIHKTLWGTVAGVFVMSKSGLETLRTHFRRFLLVQLPDGERWFFRYYDPRILKLYLEHCRPDELEIFFGPVRGFGIMQAEDDQVLLLHLPTDNSATWSAPVAGAPWRITREQYEALAARSREQLEARMLDHLNRVSPQRFSGLGEARVRELVRGALAKADQYGFNRETELCAFTELAFAFGLNFDENAAIPWAGATLRDTRIGDLSARLARLLDLAKRTGTLRSGTSA